MNQEATATQEKATVDPGIYQVNVTSPKAATIDGTTEFTAELQLGANLDEMVEKFGSDSIYNLACRMAVTDVGNKCRAMMNPNEDKDGEPIPGTSATPDQLKEFVSNWRPGMKALTRAVDPINAAIAHLKSGKASKEEAMQLAELLKSAGVL